VVSCDIGDKRLVEQGNTLAVEFEGIGTACGCGAVWGVLETEFGKTKVIKAKSYAEGC
jgi:hypothetical protein